jgi:hypothetical protein
MRKELFYVAASRGRASVTIVIGDRDLLRESVAHSVARQSASELSRKAQEPALERLKRLYVSVRAANCRLHASKATT